MLGLLVLLIFIQHAISDFTSFITTNLRWLVPHRKGWLGWQDCIKVVMYVCFAEDFKTSITCFFCMCVNPKSLHALFAASKHFHVGSISLVVSKCSLSFPLKMQVFSFPSVIVQLCSSLFPSGCSFVNGLPRIPTARYQWLVQSYLYLLVRFFVLCYIKLFHSFSHQ